MIVFIFSGVVQLVLLAISARICLTCSLYNLFTILCVLFHLIIKTGTCLIRDSRHQTKGPHLIFEKV